MSFCPLMEDSGHVSCKLDEYWFEKAHEQTRYKKALVERLKLQLRWNYESDCQCQAYELDKHDPQNECKVCGRCVADEPMLGDSHDSYESKPYCIECVMALENVGIEEIAPLFG